MGGLAFLVLSPHLAFDQETIVIHARTRESVIERRTNLEGRELTPAERDRAIADYLRDEILVREAHRNGWHLENGRVRQRLVLAMRTALNEDVPEPSRAQLQALRIVNFNPPARACGAIIHARMIFTASVGGVQVGRRGRRGCRRGLEPQIELCGGEKTNGWREVPASRHKV